MTYKFVFIYKFQIQDDAITELIADISSIETWAFRNGFTLSFK